MQSLRTKCHHNVGISAPQSTFGKYLRRLQPQANEGEESISVKFLLLSLFPSELHNCFLFCSFPFSFLRGRMDPH